MTKPENGTHGRHTRTLFLILLAGFFLIAAFGLTFVAVREAVAEGMADFAGGVARRMTDFTSYVARGMPDRAAGFLDGVEE